MNNAIHYELIMKTNKQIDKKNNNKKKKKKNLNAA